MKDSNGQSESQAARLSISFTSVIRRTLAIKRHVNVMFLADQTYSKNTAVLDVNICPDVLVKAGFSASFWYSFTCLCHVIWARSHSYLRQLGFTVTGEEREVVDLVLNHEVLLFPLEVLQRNTDEASGGDTLCIWMNAVFNEMVSALTCDLHQRMKISATILKSWLEPASGSFSQRDLRDQRCSESHQVHHYLGLELKKTIINNSILHQYVKLNGINNK